MASAATRLVRDVRYAGTLGPRCPVLIWPMVVPGGGHEWHGDHVLDTERLLKAGLFSSLSLSLLPSLPLSLSFFPWRAPALSLALHSLSLSSPVRVLFCSRSDSENGGPACTFGRADA
eukprot:2772668-Rhodomonas_salina.2